MELLPCECLPVNSANILSVKHCFAFKSLPIILSVIKYNYMLMCHVFLLELSIPFVLDNFSNVLFLFNVGSQSYPCCFRKFLVHNKCDSTSFFANNSDFVELFIDLLLHWFFGLIFYPCLIHLMCEFLYLYVPQK